MVAPELVGRILDPATLPGGAALVMKAARKAGGWWVWATRAEVLRPVKETAAKDAADGQAVYVDRPFDRVFVKGRHASTGRRFVVTYLGGKSEGAYIHTTTHRGALPGRVLSFTNVKDRTPDEPFEFTTERPSMRPATITETKTYIAEGDEAP